ncbi:MAG: EF-hand domain-containing protein [Planctomycetes bacterium]|nr:EF-hand domain-containing protein [Planctomycetota bacterium]
MNAKIGIWLFAATLLCGGLSAQMGGAEEGDETDAEVNSYFETLDTDKNETITLSELKAALRKEATTEEGAEMLYLTYLQMYLLDYLSADKDDNNELTKAELKKYVTSRNSDMEFKADLSAKDMKVVEAEYLTPYVDEIYKEMDTDKDGSLTRKEAAAADNGEEPSDEEWKAVDTDSDGKVSKAEFSAYLKSELAKSYNVAKDDKSTESKPDETKPAEGKAGDTDAFALYKKKGRTWTMRTESDYSGFKNTSYMKTEIIEVTETYAMVKYTMLDKDKKAYPGMEPTETKLEFKTATGNGGTPAEAPKTEDETIKVEAGEFECVKTTTEANGAKSIVWTSKKTPGLLVKVVSEASGGKTTMELIEFKDE